MHWMFPAYRLGIPYENHWKSQRLRDCSPARLVAKMVSHVGSWIVVRDVLRAASNGALHPHLAYSVAELWSARTARPARIRLLLGS
jgi:hypothetical protein